MVSIIIVTTNNLRGINNSIRSLQSQSFKDFEITIIFNNSEEGIVNIVTRNFPRINFIINKENLLFAKAYNQGIIQSKGEYVLCLNDDVVLADNFIEEAVKAISLDKQIGMVSGKILRMDKTIIDSAGQFLGRSRKAIERGFNQQDNGRYNKEGYIFGVNGAAAFYRRRMLDDIKTEDEYFDESYGLFYEDLDINWRAANLGWRAYYNPRAVAYHTRGATAKSQNPSLKFLRKYYFPHLSEELQFHFIKNRYMTIIKNDNLKGFLLDFQNILFYDLKLWGYILLFRPRLILKIPKIFIYLKNALEKRRVTRIRLKCQENLCR